MKTNLSNSEAKANFNRAKVLIIEDNDDQWIMIERAMAQSLPEVARLRVPTIEQALALLDQWQSQEWEIPKLILLDLYLPHSSTGWQFLEQVKAMPAPFKHIPIVILSSSADQADIGKSYELGISSYLVKPTQFEDWLAYFQQVRQYWWETVTLPPVRYRI